MYKINLSALSRRDIGLGVLGLGAAAFLMPRSGLAEGALQAWWDDARRDLKDLADDAREAAAYFMGMESYVFGYPLVMMDVTREVLTAAPAPNAEGTAAPINQLAKMPDYVSPDFKNVVRISLNSLWTTGWLDLENEPIVLSVPDTKDRYYVFSMMNMWTDVFGSVGKRTTGTSSGNFLIVGPNWKGTAPSDVKETFRSSTRYAWALGQTQANGPADFAAVNAIQARYKLTPLSTWGKPYTPPDNVPSTASQHQGHAARPGGANGCRNVLQPPRHGDERQPAVCRGSSGDRELKKLGIEPGKPFDIAKVDRGIAAGLNKAVKEVQIKMAEDVTKIKNVNGWINLTNLGRYGTDYNTRAGVAYMGLGADMHEDTVYPTAYVDGDGKPLDSANKYVMRFEKDQLPPTNGAWSVSQYKGNFYVRNILNRYVIAPWMPLKFNADGSLDIYLQATRRARTRSRTGCRPRRGSSTSRSAIISRRRRPGTAPTRSHRSRRRSESVPSSSRGEKEMAIRRLLAVVGAGEAFTGLALAIYPSLVVRLLFGAEIPARGL